MANLGNPKNTIEIIQKYEFMFQKKFGQNFLIDTHVLEKIISAAGITKNDCVLEIGPGIGTMTQYLAENAGHVVAVEIDRNLIPILKETLADYDNVTVINEDILRVDIKALAEEYNGGKPIKVVANLPYYITTPIIMGLFESGVPIDNITVMVQKEVADRMKEGPGSKDYGALSLAVQYYAEPEIVANVLKEKGLSDVKGITIMPANDLVDMHDDPATVLRRKPDSSMAVAFKLLKAGEGDALVSAGNTGALLTGATLYGGRIKGIRRGALAPVMPCANGQVMLCDAGANTECTAEMLLQFAFLASLYAEKINGVVKPRVGLVNNGTEDTKGDPLRKEAYALLKKAGDEGRLNFVGNVEGSMVPLGACDVAVCDGFTGNVQLKTIEGVAKFMSKEIKGVFMASVGTKLGYLLCKKGMDDFREVFNQDKIGGAPFLGIAKPVIKAHGSSNEIAVMNAVRQAIAYTKSGMIDAVKENIQYMTVSE